MKTRNTPYFYELIEAMDQDAWLNGEKLFSDFKYFRVENVSENALNDELSPPPWSEVRYDTNGFWKALKLESYIFGDYI